MMAQKDGASVETSKAIAEAFNAHDLDAIMEFFAEDCALDMPRGPEPWGQRFEGKAAVREGLASRFKGLPDVHYGDDRHWVSGNLGVSEWLLTGTTPDGRSLRVRGCDHWEFRGRQGRPQGLLLEDRREAGVKPHRALSFTSSYDAENA